MLTSLRIRNFKRFDDVSIELGNPVVFIGPNNSGKSTALQALALWDIGIRRWIEKRGRKETPDKRPGVAINRRDLIAVPVPTAKLLWRDLHVRNVDSSGDRPRTQNIRIDVIVGGVSEGKEWSCGLEFDFANEESFHVRPIRPRAGDSEVRVPVPPEAEGVKVAFLPPMSGLAANETLLPQGAVDVRIGEGRTAEVLRNLCFSLIQNGHEEDWQRLRDRMHALFGVDLQPPESIPVRGELEMAYRDPRGVLLDLSSAGRGLHQVLLLLAYLYANPGSVVLLDEPDAHLEILRQRQIYSVLCEEAAHKGCQIIAASHSEVLLQEAADRDVVVAFVGPPHRIGGRGAGGIHQALQAFGWDHYYQAELRGWALYLEGSTDLSILREFARRLNHGAAEALQAPFVHYVLDRPGKAYEHFRAMKEAKSDFVGLALFDSMDLAEGGPAGIVCHCWGRREIENYLCQPKTLKAFAADLAAQGAAGPLFAEAEKAAVVRTMEECIAGVVPPFALQDPQDEWWRTVKASDEFLDRLFRRFFVRLHLPNLLSKSDYHRLAPFVPDHLISPEIGQVLDKIESVAASASPVR